MMNFGLYCFICATYIVVGAVGRVWCGRVVEGYIEGNDGIYCSHWNPMVSERLLFDPYSAVNRGVGGSLLLVVGLCH